MVAERSFPEGGKMIVGYAKIPLEHVYQKMEPWPKRYAPTEIKVEG